MNPSTHEVKSTLHHSRLNNTSMLGLLLKYQILLINGTSIPSRNWRREYAIGLKKNVFLWSSLIYSQVVKYLRKFMKLCYRSLLSEMLWDFNIYKLWWWKKKPKSCSSGLTARVPLKRGTTRPHQSRSSSFHSTYAFNFSICALNFVCT